MTIRDRGSLGHMVRNLALRAVGAALALTLSLPAIAGETLQTVRARGKLLCGINEDLPGFAARDRSGEFHGLNADFCRAVAAAALGDGGRVAFFPVTSAGRFPLLLSRKIDLLVHTTTWTLGREAGIGVRYPGVYFFDGQAFLVSRGKGGLSDLAGATICLAKGTTHEENLANTFRMRNIGHSARIVESLVELVNALKAGDCQAATADRSTLVALKGRISAPDAFDILPELISQEPLGPVVRRGDEDWFLLIRWVLFALIEAEERGVSRSTVLHLYKTSSDPALRVFLGASGQLGRSLGVAPDWVVRVIEAVGNYGEIYERNLGSQSSLRLERGLNRLAKDGGLLYSPSFQ